MVMAVVGELEWSCERDVEGHRDYTLISLIESTDPTAGPASVFSASGVRAIGSLWTIAASYANDTDDWAFCTPEWKVRPVITAEPNYLWTLEQKFTTRPLKRCQTDSIENPLLEPATISGTFNNMQREMSVDRNGQAIMTSSYERLRGKVAERDVGRAQVVIGYNVSTLGADGLATLGSILHIVNDSTMWNYPARCVKLSGISFERKLYGTCTYYYTVTYTFDCDWAGFDVLALDEGTRVLGYAGTGTNPTHFIQYKDKAGNPGRVILDGTGQAWDGVGDPGTVYIEHYDEANLLSLPGVPSTIGE